MTQKKPVEEHERRGPKPKGNRQVSFQLSPAAIAIVKDRADRVGLSRSEWLEFLIFKHARADLPPFIRNRDLVRPKKRG
jgi:hypothetical protein